MKARKRKASNQRRPNAPALPKDAMNIIRYWQASLLDAQRMGISGKELHSGASDIPFPDLMSGRCPAGIVNTLFERASESAAGRAQGVKSPSRFESADSGSALPILICPLRMSWTARTNPSELGLPRFVELLWIPADLTRGGILSPSQFQVPWIPRELLEPTSGDESLTVGSVDDLDSYYRQHEMPTDGSWAKYWAWCDEFFRAVTGESTSRFSIPDYERRKNASIVVDNTSSGSTRQALRLFDQILERKRHPGLLLQLASLKERADRKPVYTRRTVSALKRGGRRHRGQFGYSFPLSPSQRRAVHQFLSTAPGEILTVTGPPGTGKTTLLQSIIASLWVDATQTRNAYPPVVLACAGTNQAVTNIVDSFSKSETRPGPLAGRWLPGVTSYGCYCPSEAKVESAQFENIHLERTTGDGLSREMLRRSYVKAAADEFLQKYSSFSGKTAALPRAVEHLRKLIEVEISAIYRTVGRESVSSLVDWLSGFVGIGNEANQEQLTLALEALDCSHRHTAFQLATHYWEGRWLLEASSRVESDADGRGRSESAWVEAGHDEWALRAMITPCFVSTFAMAPRFFGKLTDTTSQPVDVLIVDEASQILPEEGAATFALARKALVVGDTQQLEPVRTIPEFIDLQNLKKFKVVSRGKPEELVPLIRKGLTSAHGSIMKLAQSACRIVDENTVGVFLSEHRRSVPGIIAFCNAWAYRNRLVPLRPALSEPLFPALGYAHVPGESQSVGSSRENISEAESIREWLDAKRVQIEQRYGGAPLDELVAVITPFSAQKRRLVKLLRGDYPRMTIGTVHGLQGAERKIVIFSPVYDQSFRGEYFFDRDDKMLNVAVSRAQDSFLVVGDMGTFNPLALDHEGRVTASALLARFLFADPNNELPRFAVPVRSRLRRAELHRLTTLEEHQQLLADALTSAQQEVLVVSPTLSPHALRADGIPDLVKATVQRGVRVLVYADTYLNSETESGALKASATEASRLLASAGASVIFINGIHNKTLAIDEEVLVEGSFNWFSAVRDPRSKFQKLEISFCYSGTSVRDEIRNTKAFLRNAQERASADAKSSRVV